MPQHTAPTNRFDEAIARLRAIAGPANDGYIRHHRDRCIDDALRLAEAFPGGRILNLGGKPYLFEFIASDLGLQVDTIDLAPERNPAEIMALDGKVMRIDIEDPDSRAALDLQPYDVICMAEMLEHLRIDLIGTLRFLAQNMRSDARLFLTTPNFYFAANFLKMLAQGRSGPSLVDEWRKLEAIGHMGHVREYSRKELDELFAFSGFVIEHSFVRNSRKISLREGGLAQWPIRALGHILAGTSDRFGQELVYLLKPARAD